LCRERTQFPGRVGTTAAGGPPGGRLDEHIARLNTRLRTRGGGQPRGLGQGAVRGCKRVWATPEQPTTSAELVLFYPGPTNWPGIPEERRLQRWASHRPPIRRSNRTPARVREVTRGPAGRGRPERTTRSWTWPPPRLDETMGLFVLEPRNWSTIFRWTRLQIWVDAERKITPSSAAGGGCGLLHPARGPRKPRRCPTFYADSRRPPGTGPGGDRVWRPSSASRVQRAHGCANPDHPMRAMPGPPGSATFEGHDRQPAGPGLSGGGCDSAFYVWSVPRAKGGGGRVFARS